MFSLLSLLVLAGSVKAQTVTVGNVETGTYGRRSDITVPITVNGCFQRDNEFKLFLIFPNNTKREIGVFRSHFATFINGIIPIDAITSSNYKLEVTSTKPALTIPVSGNISISDAPGPTINIETNANEFKPEIFGFCPGNANNTIELANKSTSGAVVTGMLKNDLNPAAPQKAIDFSQSNFNNLQLDLAYFTASLKASHNNLISTKSYVILNSTINLAFDNANIDGCTPETVFFRITHTGPNGFATNYPGYVYEFDWDDDQKDYFTHCQLNSIQGEVSHLYNESSCGRVSQVGNQIVANVYGAKVNFVPGLFCGRPPAPSFAKISKKPQALIFQQPIACLGQVTFENKSINGSAITLGPTGNLECRLESHYQWFVNGVQVASFNNVTDSRNANLNYDFTVPGTYEIKLLARNATCPDPDEDIFTICIVEKPEASFNLTQESCIPAKIEVTNTTLPPLTSCVTYSYKWQVVNKATNAPYVPTFLEGSATSKDAKFTIADPGRYLVKLLVSNGANASLDCSGDEFEQEVEIFSPVNVTLPADAGYCRPLPLALDFSTDAKHMPLYSGVPLNENIQWSISGPGGTFTGGTNAHSKYPVFEFSVPGTYTVTLTYSSACNSGPAISRSQKIYVYPAITVNAGNDATICYFPLQGTNNQYTLQGSSLAAGQTGEWTIISGPNTPVFSNASTHNAVAKNLVPGVYKFRWTVKNPSIAGQANCAEFDEVEITVSAPPAKPVALKVIDLCQGSAPYLLSATALSGHQLHWFSDASLSSTTTTAPTFDPVNTGTYTFLVFQATPSPDNCPSDTTKIIVKVFPPIQHNELEPVGSICYNASPGTLKIKQGLTLSGGAGNFSYQWQVKDGSGVFQDIPNAIWPEYAPGLLTETKEFRRIVRSGGCETASASVLVTVYPQVLNPFGLAEQEICENQVPALLDPLPASGGNGSFTYQWQSSFNGSTWLDISGSTAEDYQPGALTTTTYFRRLASNFCVTNLASGSVRIVVKMNALAEFTASKTKSCAPFNINSATIIVNSDASRNATYKWYVREGGTEVELPSNSYQFPGYTIMDPGKAVTIKLVTTPVAGGCSASEKEMVFETYNVINYASFTYTKDNALNCGPLSVTFTNTSSPLTGVNFEWDFGNGQTSTLAQPPPVTFLPSPDNNDITYKVKLRVFTDCDSRVDSQLITVRSSPIAVFSPDKTVICSGNTVNFTNQSRGGGNTYVYKLGDGTTISSTDRSPVSHTYHVTVKTTFKAQLIATNECGSDTSSYDIVVSPNNVHAELVVNGNQKSGCAPFTVNFDNNSTGANTFVWDFDDGNTHTNIGAPRDTAYTFNIPGTYRVKLTAINGCAVDSTFEEITVYPSPVVGFTTANTIYCQGEEIQFNNTSATGLSYLWNFGNGATSTQINPKVSYHSGGTFTVKLTAVQSFHDGTQCTKEVEKQIEIVPLPVPLTTSNISALNCAPFKLEISSISTNAHAVDWDFGDSGNADVAVGNSVTYTYNTPGTYTITLNTYNSLGCVKSIQIPVTVIASPIAKIEGDDIRLCKTSEVITFTNKTTYTGTGTYSCKWIVDNTVVSTSKGNLTRAFAVPSNATLPHKFTVVLEATSTFGCTTRDTQYVFFDPIPAPSFHIVENIGCPPFTPQLINNTSNADTYEWYLDNQLVSTEENPENIVLNEPGRTYKLKLIAKNSYGCETVSAEQDVSTYSTPNPSFVLAETVGCNGILTLDFQNIDLGGSTSYEWDFGDGSPRTSVLRPTKVYSVPGRYSLKLTGKIGDCISTYEQEIVVVRPLQPIAQAGPANGCRQYTVEFRNMTLNASRVIWDFGDGTYSGEWSPRKVYTHHNSPYHVKLIAYSDQDQCEQVIDVETIVVNPPPKPKFIVVPGNTIKIPNYTFNFEQKCEGAIKYKWDFGDHSTFSEEENPVHVYKDVGRYVVKLTATNEFGCDSTFVDTVVIETVPGHLYVPNAFEPGNPDSKVKYFHPEGTALVMYELKIFNRWGKLIWTSTKLDENGAPAEGWDGTIDGLPAPQGVYIWDISGKFIDGTEWKGMKYEGSSRRKSGPVHLIR